MFQWMRPTLVTKTKGQVDLRDEYTDQSLIIHGGNLMIKRHFNIYMGLKLILLVIIFFMAVSN